MFGIITDNVWSIAKPLKAFGVEVGCKMTIIKLSDGSLFIHSPIALNEAEISELKSMGEVKYIIAPNLFHYLYVKDFINYFPDAKSYCPAGMDKKCPDLSFNEMLVEGKRYPWADELEQFHIKGAPEVNEVVFFSKTDLLLTVTDLVFNIQNVSGVYNTIGHFFNNSYKKLGASRHCQLYVKDKQTYLNSVRRILQWDFEKIIMSHGENVLVDGKKIFKQYLDSQI